MTHSAQGPDGRGTDRTGSPGQPCSPLQPGARGPGRPGGPGKTGPSPRLLRRSVPTIRPERLPARYRAVAVEPDDFPWASGTGPPAKLPPVPDPFEDADALEEIEEEVITLAGHIHVGTYRFLVLVAEFDRRRGWELGGHRSCAHWLHFVTGFDLGTAREKVRVARALGGLPLIAASMARGRLSFSKVRAVTRAADAENEEELLEVAEDSTTAQLERFIRAYKKGSRREEETKERTNHRLRRVRC